MRSPRWFFTNVLVVMAVIAVAGCGQRADKVPATGHSGESAAEEDHHHHDGVHGGQVIELGSENYHAELIHDDATHKVGVYFLDSSAKAAAPVDAKSVTVNVAVDGQPSIRHELRESGGDVAGQGLRLRRLALRELILAGGDPAHHEPSARRTGRGPAAPSAASARSACGPCPPGPRPGSGTRPCRAGRPG